MLILKHHRILFLFYCYNQHVDKGLSAWVMSHIVHLHGLMTECLGHVSNCSSAWSHDSVPVSCIKLFICMVSWLSACVMSQIVHLHGFMTQCLGHVSNCSSAWSHDSVPGSCLILFICMASWLSACVMSQIVHLHGLIWLSAWVMSQIVHLHGLIWLLSTAKHKCINEFYAEMLGT